MKVLNIRLDLNNPVFQSQLFNLTKEQQTSVLSSLRKISNMTWNQLYRDAGFNWEVILSRTGPHGGKIYSLRLVKASER